MTQTEAEAWAEGFAAGCGIALAVFILSAIAHVVAS